MSGAILPPLLTAPEPSCVLASHWPSSCYRLEPSAGVGGQKSDPPLKTRFPIASLQGDIRDKEAAECRRRPLSYNLG